jgi:ketosteroid isomerase-like protein
MKPSRAAARRYDAVLALFAPNAVWDVSALGLGAYAGREAIRRFFEDWGGAYEDLDSELEEFWNLDNDVTLAVVVQRGRPARGGGGWVKVRYASVTIWDGGMIESAFNFTDIDEARGAAERLARELG